MARNTKKTEDYEYRHIPQIMNVNILIGWFFFSALSFGGGVSNNPTINISPTNITVNEGDSGTSTVSLTITASDCPDTSDIKIHWETADGTAKTSNNDYVGASGDVTFSVPGWSDSCDDADKSKRISVTVNGDTQIEPDETFKITISDGGTSSSQNFTIGDSTSTITIKNDDSTPPVAQNDTATTDEDTPVTIDVLANDSDPDGDSLSIESVSDPAHGNATINADGTITYTPASNYNGNDSFSYTVSDGNGGTDTATVAVTINPVNDAPTAVDLDLQTPVDTPVHVPISANDPDGDPIQSYPILGNGPSHGTLSGPDTNLTYIPNAGYEGEDTFLYQACDSNGACSEPATVRIFVQNGPRYVDNPVICVESQQYTKAGGPISSCFNSTGHFEGGVGCQQALKIRNLSNDPISDSAVLVDYSRFAGALDGTCGIDGTDRTGNGCVIHDENKTIEYDPVGPFEPFGRHLLTAGVQAGVFGSSPYDGNMTVHYTSGGVEYYGPLKKCRNIVQEADDLCYSSDIIDGMLCMDMGFMNGGFDCTRTIVLQNQSGEPLQGVSTNLVTRSLVDGSFIDECGVDDNESNCSDDRVLDFPFMGFSWLGMPSTVTYDPMPDFGSDQNHSIFTRSTISGAIFSDTTLFGTYVKDGVLYRGVIHPCRPCAIVQFAKPRYDVRENINEYGTTKPVYPVIVINRRLDHNITLHYHTVDGTAKAADGDYVPVDNGTVILPAGENNVSIPIYIYNDRPIELEEYFTVQLDNPPDGVCLGDQNSTEIHILAQNDVPICFEDDFENGQLDDLWHVRTIRGNFTPHIVDVNGDHRLRITDQNHNESTLITKDYKFDTRYNLIIVEFDYYDYGGCEDGHNYKEHHGHNLMGDWGADGIANVLFNSDVGAAPAPGAYGGALGYAQMVVHTSWADIDKAGFEGGWLGLGLDEFGNYAKPNEGKEGGITDNYVNAVSIRGDGNGTEGYEYLAGTETISPPIAAHLSDPAPDDYFSGRYKMTVDARDPDHLYITLERSTTGDPSDYQVIINRFDAKDPSLNQGSTPDFVRYAITGSTGGGCNNHEISWIRVRGNCAVYGVHPGAENAGNLDAWDTFRNTNNLPNVNDLNISTKIAAKDFNLSIAPLDENRTKIKRMPEVTQVCYRLASVTDINSTDSNYSYVPDVGWRTFDANATQLPIKPWFKTRYAMRNAAVVFRFCGKYEGGQYFFYPPTSCEGNCTDAGLMILPKSQAGIGWREELSTDRFAIRPDRFEISASSISGAVIAGREFNLTIVAKDGEGNRTRGYNEPITIRGTSPSLEYNDTKPNCAPDTMNLSLVSGGVFADGEANLTLNYNEVGELNITITEKPGSEFAAIDQNDTNYSNSDANTPNNGIGREIEANSTTIAFNPDHFVLRDVALHDWHESNSDINFTYMAKQNSSTPKLDTNMTAQLDLNITAVNEQNVTTKNFNAACYASDINLTLAYTVNGTEANGSNPGGTIRNILYGFDYPNGGGYRGYAPLGASVDINGSQTARSISRVIFDTDNNGSASMRIWINFDRNMSNPVRPFRFEVTDVNVSNTITSDMNDSAGSDHNATFVYGRVRSAKTFYDNITASSVSTPVSIEIYSDDPTVINTLYWRPTDAFRWYLNTVHQAAGSHSDGNVTLESVDTNGSVSPSDPTSVSFTGGVANGVTVTAVSATRPLIVDINLTGTDPWLIYNPDREQEPSPFYRVRFINVGSWSGSGQTGNVVGGGVYRGKSRQVEW